MLDIAEELHRWVAQGRDFAVATVVSAGGSAPRQPGAALAVDADGTAIGSVSGGCVEAAVYDLCQRALDDGRTVLERYGHSDEDAFAVGLTCGGVIDVLVTPVRAGDAVRDVVGAALADAASGHTVALARVIAGPAELLGRSLHVRSDGSYQGGCGAGDAVDRRAAAQARALLDAGRTGAVQVRRTAEEAADGGRGGGANANVDAGARLGAGAGDGADAADGAAVGAIGNAGAIGSTGAIGSAGAIGGADGDAGAGEACGAPLTLFVESTAPPPRMIVFGAVDFASALVRVGAFLGYRVTVCDARPVFATPARFPDADEVVVEWPHRYLERTDVDGRTVLCVLTHDAKFDVPLLHRALGLPVGYVGAMGSRRTHEDRLRRLREVGVGEPELARLRSPIGLDLGARTPEETALSIAAEIVATRRGGSGAPLTGGRAPIHRDVLGQDAFSPS